jgi:hypothetical protein
MLGDHVFVLSACTNSLPDGWVAEKRFVGGEIGPFGKVSVDVTVATGDRYRLTIERQP